MRLTLRKKLGCGLKKRSKPAKRPNLKPSANHVPEIAAVAVHHDMMMTTTITGMTTDLMITAMTIYFAMEVLPQGLSSVGAQLHLMSASLLVQRHAGGHVQNPRVRGGFARVALVDLAEDLGIMMKAVDILAREMIIIEY